MRRAGRPTRQARLGATTQLPQSPPRQESCQERTASPTFTTDSHTRQTCGRRGMSHVWSEGHVTPVVGGTRQTCGRRVTARVPDAPPTPRAGARRVGAAPDPVAHPHDLDALLHRERHRLHDRVRTNTASQPPLVAPVAPLIARRRSSPLVARRRQIDRASSLSPSSPSRPTAMVYIARHPGTVGHGPSSSVSVSVSVPTAGTSTRARSAIQRAATTATTCARCTGTTRSTTSS